MLIHTLLRHEATLEDLAGEMDTSAYHDMVNNMGHLFVTDPTTNHEVKNFEYSVKKRVYREHWKDGPMAGGTAHPK